MIKKLRKFRRENGGLYWFIVAATFVIGFWPVGIFLILAGSILKGDEAEETGHPYGPADQETPSSRAETPGRPAKSGNPKAMLRKTKGNLLILIGGILAVIFFISGIDQFLLWMPEYPLDAFRDSYIEFLFMGLSILAVLIGINRNRRAERYRNYMAMLRGKDIAELSEVAAVSSYSLRTVKSDLQDMVGAGIFGKHAWLDNMSDCLILTQKGRQMVEKRKAENRKADDEKAKRETSSPEKLKNEEILSEIRSLNDEIENVQISDQIDRIEKITRQILEHRGESQDDDRKLHSFLDYYLPTTLKMLRTYRDLEKQDVQGENINTTMRKIEEIMGKVASGFEKQLDNLYQNDMLDITSDIAVMEQMMAKDGLSGGEGLKL